MVPVQMAVDDDVDGFRIESVARDDGRERLGFGRQVHALARAGIHLVAAAGLDQDGVIAGANQVAVERQRNAVQVVRGDLPAPQGLGHNAEDRAAVPPVGARLDAGDFESAHRNAGLGVGPRPGRRRRGHSGGVSPGPVCARARRVRRRLPPACGRVRTSPCWLPRCPCWFRSPHRSLAVVLSEMYWRVSLPLLGA